MQLQDLSTIHRPKKKRRGRGGKKGTYSGRGGKGQSARSGRKFKPLVREIIKRYPKLRGYKNRPLVRYMAAVNLSLLEKHFQKGETVTSEKLREKKLIRAFSGKAPQVKILGKGKLSKNLVIEGCLISNSARQKIEKAKGTIK